MILPSINRADLRRELIRYVMSAACCVFVQSLQDDEDDNMEDGIKLITNILGPDNIHLYPSILQLVMADGAYTEGQYRALLCNTAWATPQCTPTTRSSLILTDAQLHWHLSATIPKRKLRFQQRQISCLTERLISDLSLIHI